MSFIILRSALPRSIHSPRSLRLLSTTSSVSSATPEWTAELGGRAEVERKRLLYADKYKAAMAAAAGKQGISVEELKKSAEVKMKAEQKSRTEELENRITKTKEALMEKEGNESKGEKKSTVMKTKKSQSSPVKVSSTRPCRSARLERLMTNYAPFSRWKIFLISRK